MRKLLMLALCLTPFSNAVSNDYPVVSFGLPLLALAVALSMMVPGTSAFAVPAPISAALLSAGAVLLVMTATVFIAPQPEASLVRLVPNLICFALVARLVRIYRDNADDMLEYVLRALAISGAIMSLYYMVNLSLAIATYGMDAVMRERYVGGLAALPWGASNMISAALIFPHIACYLLRWRYRYKLADVFLALILFTTILTMSRAGMATHGALILFSALYSRNYRYIVYGLLVIIIFGVAYSYIDPDSFNYLWSDRFEGTGNDLSNGRLDTWREKSEFVVSNLMSPIGYYGSLYVFHGLTAHNFLLTLMLEQGLPGLLAFLLFAGFSVAALFRKHTVSTLDSVCRRMLIVGGVAAFVNLQVEDANFNHPYIIYFWTFFLAVLLFSLTLKSVVPERRSNLTGAVSHA